MQFVVKPKIAEVDIISSVTHGQGLQPTASHSRVLKGAGPNLLPRLPIAIEGIELNRHPMYRGKFRLHRGVN